MLFLLLARGCRGILPAVLAALFSDVAPATAEAGRLQLDAAARLLILAPHPDDEVLGCGGLIQQAREMGLPVHIGFLTHGDNNGWAFFVQRGLRTLLPGQARQMGELRAREAAVAARRLGLEPRQLSFLGYPDSGTLLIWNAHWGGSPPYRSPLTHAIAVPYTDARRPGAAYRGEEILRDITELIAEFRPTRIFVSHPADDNPDHRALYLFTQVALWDLALEPPPALHFYLVHCGDWPQPARAQPALALAPPANLTAWSDWLTLPLTLVQAQGKRRAIEAHASQCDTGAGRLLRFARANELFAYPFETVVPFSGEAFPGHDTPRRAAPPARCTVRPWRAVRAAPGSLALELSLSHPLDEASSLAVSLFAYRAGRPFDEMPKLQITCDSRGCRVADRDRPLPQGSVTLVAEGSNVTITLPRAALGEPDRLLAGAKNRSRGELLDWIPWQPLRLATAPALGSRPEASAPVAQP